jgi:hypothetical protein
MTRLLIAFIWLIGLAMVPEAQTLNSRWTACPTLEPGTTTLVQAGE